jgi:hypothetical protein
MSKELDEKIADKIYANCDHDISIEDAVEDIKQAVLEAILNLNKGMMTGYKAYYGIDGYDEFVADIRKLLGSDKGD